MIDNDDRPSTKFELTIDVSNLSAEDQDKVRQALAVTRFSATQLLLLGLIAEQEMKIRPPATVIDLTSLSYRTAGWFVGIVERHGSGAGAITVLHDAIVELLKRRTPTFKAPSTD